jgi:light-regulated signal transduction histidine kinase (bacteriophytochrome)
MQQKCPPLTASPPSDAEEDFKDFAYIVSHDLAGPVRSMVSFSQILSEKIDVLAPDEDAKLHLDLIIDSGRKLNEMIQGLLAFSRLNTVPRTVTGCDLEIVLARCNMELQPLIDLLKARLVYPAMPEITADPSRMFTLFYNLVENGLKFHRDNAVPEVRVTCQDNTDCWLFTVADNGIGIDPIFYDDVFRPLRKLHTDDAYPSAGMGLTLARKIVVQHGGNMWLEPSEMGGVKVVFTLSKTPPVAKE